ncbi:carbohydrate porin [uncultured Rhodoblastus sp.]|uniref:carbohydrate porin n=1 Tax=uncultured Rhodoblastus sp. TaxID=543037 RepID=UPI0025CDDECC|nr:carbohydrate porin [uncultured Rhodoblastus sp.]
MKLQRNNRPRPAAAVALAVALGFGAGQGAFAQESPAPNPFALAPEVAAKIFTLPDNIDPSISTSIPALAELKKAFLTHGVNFELSYLQDSFGNVTGGVRQGAVYGGIVYMLVEADLAKLAGMQGASFRVNGFQIQGGDLSGAYIYNYSPISSVEARPTTRMVELWLEQKLFSDMASVRIGQLAADTEFFNSEFDVLFVNGTFGWTTLFAGNLPGSGPGYPLSTPGVRLKLTPNEHLTVLAAIFNGDPAGTGFNGRQQIVNSNGINFRLSDPALLFGEAQYSYNQEKTGSGLAGRVKLGGWYHFGKFQDDHFGFDGLSLANPASVGIPRLYNGDYTVYGVVDQMLWRLPGDDPKKGVAGFARVAVSPGDRNLMSFYADGGVNFIGFLPQRPDDSFGLGAAYSKMAPSLVADDRDAGYFAGLNLPIRNYELALELTYKAVVLPGFNVQPDLQYIVHPGGGEANPDNPSTRIPNAFVIGIRTQLTF